MVESVVRPRQRNRLKDMFILRKGMVFRCHCQELGENVKTNHLDKSHLFWWVVEHSSRSFFYIICFFGSTATADSNYFFGSLNFKISTQKKYLTFSVTSINFRQFFFLYCSFDLILTGQKFFCNTLVLSQLCLNIFRLHGFERRQFSQFSYTQVLYCSNYFH